MKRRELGRSGISVTRVILGCGNFGGVGSSPAFFGQGIAKDEAFRIMDAAWDLGITTFDTADAYGGGRSETWIGEWLATKDGVARDTIVVETKTYNPMHEGADHGLTEETHQRDYTALLVRWATEMVLGAREGGGASGPDARSRSEESPTPAEPGEEILDEVARLG